jgi:hypothetical protein
MSRMRDLDAALNDLQYLISRRLSLQNDINQVATMGLSAALADEERQRLQKEEREARARSLKQLEDLLSFPPRHIRHKEQLDDFWRDGTYELSVFVMTKFPRTGAAAQANDAELEKVLAAVSAAVQRAGFHSRIARDGHYHPQLWDNVELHMLGCGRGIAIVEDKYLPELNPNVAMEWGWMRATVKPVLFLIEKEFTNLRADFEGLLRAEFSWADPEPGISAAVADFLK